MKKVIAYYNKDGSPEYGYEIKSDKLIYRLKLYTKIMYRFICHPFSYRRWDVTKPQDNFTIE